MEEIHNDDVVYLSDFPTFTIRIPCRKANGPAPMFVCFQKYKLEAQGLISQIHLDITLGSCGKLRSTSMS